MSKDYSQIDEILDEIVLGKANEQKLAELINEENRNDLLQELLVHQSAAAIIQRNAILEQVSAIHNRFIEKRNGFTADDFPDSALVISHKRNNYKLWWSIAAALILAPALYLLYIYGSNSPDKLFNEQYQAYRINVDRSSVPASSTSIIDHYQQGDFAAVIKDYQTLTLHSIREDIMAALAYMELKQYDAAVPLLDGVIRNNVLKSSRIYQDEAEYYLALSQLKTNKIESAYQLFNKIYVDDEHTFNGRVDKWFMMKLKWLI